MLKETNIHLYLSKKYINKESLYIKKQNKAFFSILNEKYTSKTFIQYIINDSILEAKTLISKYSNENIDINTLKQFFNDELIYKILKKVHFSKKNYEKINSFLIMDKNCNFKCIINFYMIAEPDNFSKWKIYKITKECNFIK